jgi:phosphoribosylformylglycinamidine synthase
MKATVYVRLKTEVLDPQGRAVQRALGALGIAGVRDVRIGKLIEIELEDGVPTDDLPAKLRKISDELLANPVIEDYEVKLG